MSYTEQANALLEEWVQSESLRNAPMRWRPRCATLQELNGADEDVWGAVGLLHDMDYERHPNLDHSPTEGHPFVGVAYLREHGWSEEICRAILAHADYSGVQPENALERTILAVDELSSFAVAVALVRASKSIFDVDVAAVKKKLKDKAFARAVDRGDISRGAERLEMSLDELIGHVLTALRGSADQLGIQGLKVEA